MYHLLGAEASPSTPAEQITVSLEAMDIESLLVDWLGELAYLAERERLVFRDTTFKTAVRHAYRGGIDRQPGTSSRQGH